MIRQMLKRLLLLLTGMLLGLVAQAAEVVTLTASAPIETIDAGGHPTGVSMGKVGASYSFIKQEGDNLILQDGGGKQYLVAAGATNYAPPAPDKVASTPTTNTALPATNAPPAETPAASSSASMLPSSGVPASTVSATASQPTAPLSPADAEKVKQLNDALGIPLVADTHFWQDNVGEVAKRLQWPQESQTSTQESYRLYALPNPTLVLGAPAYSLALYGKEGKPTYISMVFSNGGDFAEASIPGLRLGGALLQKVKGDLAVAVKKDAQTITEALTPILGEPTISLFGNSSSNRDEVHRWDWNDVAILLNSHNGEFTSIKMIPSDVADHFGTVEVTDRDQMRDLLAKRVVKRDNGDVVLSDMPMVDQGPKGYCVPATWERYLRYVDVPADLYVLAMMGQTDLGGGTNLILMQAGVADYVSAYHRRIETYDAPLDIVHVAKYIDQGLPLMWTCWVAKRVEMQTFANAGERKSVTDWGKYSQQLAAQDAALGPNFRAEDSARDNGHMRLIIGYNSNTKEIAISDSWGPAGAERWLYIDTATKISQGNLSYLSW